jgi:5'-deoxynucleotidase YfbR-like HD superfamily hydrolase
LWQEFEAQETKEARLLKDLDRIDAVVQALIYEGQGFAEVKDFYPYALQRVNDPTMKRILEILLKREFRDGDPYQQYFSLLTTSFGLENLHQIQSPPSPLTGL